MRLPLVTVHGIIGNGQTMMMRKTRIVSYLMTSAFFLLLFVSVNYLLLPCVNAEQSAMPVEATKSAPEAESEAILSGRQHQVRVQFATMYEARVGQTRQLSQTDDSAEETNRGGGMSL